MRITAVDEELYTNNNSGTNFGVTMGSKLFSVLTESLYKDKPRAVCRETIANCVDAHRMRDELFAGLTSDDQKWKDLVASGLSEPGTPYYIHLPTDIEPWLEFEDNGIGLPVEKILGEVQFVIDPQHPDSPPTMVRDGNGHPVRSGGVYTTLFGSDKEDNDNAIGAYGLGCKSPFAIVDTFLVKSRVNGEEHQYLMFLNSKREPQVDWLTKDPVTGEPSPLKTEKKNGLTVRMDAIPVSMKTKITVSVADILQTFPKEEQPVVNDGMFSYKPVEYEEFVCGLRIVKNFHYGHVFNNDFVVNTGGVVYPVDRSKLEEVLSYEEVKSLRLYASEKCIVMEMPLGTVNIPPSREEISYDEVTMNNIVAVLRPALDHIQKLKSEILDKMELNLSSLWKTRAELCKLEPDNFSQIIREKWESLVEEKKKIGREAGVAIGYHDNGFKAYAQIKEDLSWVTPTRDFRIYRDNHYGLNAVNMDDYVLTESYHKRKICPESEMLIDITSMSDRKAIVVLNDTQFGRGTVLTRLKKLRDEDLNVLFEGLVDNENPLPEVVIMVGASNKDVDVEFDDYVKFTEYLCRVGNFNYILGSEVCEVYEKMPRKLKHVTQTEINRNLAHLAFRINSSKAYEEYAPNNVFEIEEEDKDFTYILRDEMPQLEGLRCDSYLEQYARSRGVLGEKTFVVNGIRTDSRRMCDSLPYFRRVDLEALKQLDYECKMTRLENAVTRNSPLKDPVAEYGLKTILGALLFAEFISEHTSFGNMRQFLVWLQVFVNRHPLVSFEENDEAFRHYGDFTLGDLYERTITFDKILGGRSIPRAKIPQQKMQYRDLENLRDRYGRFRSNLEDCLEPTIWAFSAVNIAPWKRDMDLLAQVEAVFREREFKSLHNGVFPTVLLKRGMIHSTYALKNDLEKITSKFAGQLSKIIGEHQVLLERIPQHWAEREVAQFHNKLESSLCVCRLGRWNEPSLKGTRSFFPQFKTSKEIEEEKKKAQESQTPEVVE